MFRRVSNGYVWLDKMFCFVSSLELVTAVSSCQLLDETACVLEREVFDCELESESVTLGTRDAFVRISLASRLTR